MDNKNYTSNWVSLGAYFIVLILFCAGFIIGAKTLGQAGRYLAQGYMLTPAIAAVITRLFFYPPKFKDANLRFGKASDYFKFWILSLCITMLSYGLFSLMGAITWDFSGEVFLGKLKEQFAVSGKDISETLPPGFSPKMMLVLFFIGGLTIFNIVPGMLTGFGEEFGHRGFMFPMLYQIRPWVGLLVGGVVWYAWHLPLALVIPKTVEYPLWQEMLNFVILGIGAISSFIYFCYVYVKSKSVFVTSLAHIAMNNSAASFSYFAVLKSQLIANLALSVTMLIVVIWLYRKNKFSVFKAYFESV